MSKPDGMTRAADLSKLNPPDTAPKDGRQIVAWGVPLGRDDAMPRWCVVQWVAPYGVGKPYWSWSVPGYGTSVTLLGWLDLPWNDEIADYALQMANRRAAVQTGGEVEDAHP